MKTIKDEKRRTEYQAKLKRLNVIPDKLIKQAQLQESIREERLIYKGDKGALFCYLIAGSISVSDILNDGSLLTISRISAPCMIGEMELIDPTSETMEVTLQDKSVIFVWNLKDVEAALLNDNNFLRELSRTVARKERQSIRQLARERSMNARQRLASFILENCKNHEHELIFTIRKTIVAERLGISYRHTEKLFYDLIAEGTIKKEGLSYIVNDVKALQKIVEPN